MQRHDRSCLFAIGLFSLLGSAAGILRAQPAATTEPGLRFSDQKIAFFESEIRPLLVERCWKCHGERKQEGGLRLDSRAAVLAGGDLGAAATPGDPAASRISGAVGYAGDIQMPPKGKLSEREIAAINRWVRDGLAWSKTDSHSTPTSGKSGTVTAPRPIPWSFQPVVDPMAPNVQKPNWCRSPLDRFVLSRLEAAGINPAPQADKRTLIRRAKFDLLGLPPTPDEIAAFLSDHAPNAFARLIDRFLASPEYGQRWGRHWLDVARYADSNGQDENLAYINAFRYRDYVVDAFNGDKPYDQFVREQLAGDLLPDSRDDEQRYERLVATGFLTLGPKMLAEDDPVKMEMDIVDEQVDTIGAAFLGLTLGCARCHDHKFDPILTADYYALAGIFKSTRTMDNFKVVAKWHERPLATPAEVAAVAEHRDRVAGKKAELAAHVDRANRALATTARKRLADYLLAATELLDAPALVSLVQDSTAAGGTSLPPETVLREAENFDRGNVLVDTTHYGAGIGIILNRGELPNYVEYDLKVPRAGSYQLELRYAAAESRSVQVLIDGKLRKADVAAQATGSWNPDSQQWCPEGVFELPAGKVVLRIERASGPFPHVDRVALVPRTTDPSHPIQAPRTPEEVARERGLLVGFLTQWLNHLTLAKRDANSVWQLWFAYQKNADISPDRFRGVAAAVANRVLAAGKPATAAELATRYQAVIEAAASFDRTSLPAAEKKATPTPGDAPADPAEAALRRVLSDPQGPVRTFAQAAAHYSAPDRDTASRLQSAIVELERAAPPALQQAMAVEDGKATDLRIHLRGSHLALGEIAPRGFPRALGGMESPLPSTASGRLELAQWVTNSGNPLVSRVMVNRLWRWHFGAGLVRSTDNFGNLGERPSHPELLDWLAMRFVASGWSVKAMHRLIMLSATYQMSTTHNATASNADPDNRLLWRMNRRRLEAEAVRDALLYVGGQLDTSLRGTLLKAKSREYVTGTASTNVTNYVTDRRSLYLPVVRSALYEPFQAFDFAEPTTIKGDRESTTIASQALFMMNSDVVNEHSSKLAARLVAQQPNGGPARVRDLYYCTLGRAPAESEAVRALAFVDRYATAATDGASTGDVLAWQALCRVLLSSNEFLYVE